MTNDKMSPDVSSDDKLWAALGYVFTPFVPIIVLLLEDKKDVPFIRVNNVQALAWSVAFFIIATVLSFTLIGICLWPLGYVLQLYWAYQAFQGQEITIPVITDFVKKQGWA